MPTDIAAFLFVLTLSMLTMAVALPSVMGRVNGAARLAQAGILLQAVGWVLLLASGQVAPGGWIDRLLSTLSMAGISAGLVLNARAFDLWCGRPRHARAPTVIAVLLTLGYGLGFSSYPFRVGWANGLLAVQMALVALTLSRRPLLPIGRWRWLLVLALLAQMVVTAWRGVLGAFYTDQFPNFFAPHPVNIAFALVANVTAVLSLVGILLAHRDEAARALERLATLDGLTGVFNRRAWLQQAHKELAVSVRYDYPLAVLMLDLDHFKLINDSRGHEAGDRALQFFAQALQNTCRTGDIACRYGGEEFCVLMTRASPNGSSAFDTRLRRHLAQMGADELGHTLDYSAGVAVRLAPDDTLEAMLRRADVALYRAKALGRGRTVAAPWPGEQLELVRDVDAARA